MPGLRAKMDKLLIIGSTAVQPQPKGREETDDPKRLEHPMKWITREKPKTDRVACPWLIRKFIDPDAEILYVPDDRVLEVARREGAVSFDAPGARYGHRKGKCTFEVLIEEYHLTDPALLKLAEIVHGADVQDERSTPQSAGLRAIGEGFIHVVPDDHENLRIQSCIYDALYAWCRARSSGRD
ncbi:MAG: chromate resistance protein ChrB domain-containing protein [Planctomycetota bacterium]